MRTFRAVLTVGLCLGGPLTGHAQLSDAAADSAPEGLHQQFGPDFQLVQTAREEHHTPAGATQPFVYCLCRMTMRPRVY